MAGRGIANYFGRGYYSVYKNYLIAPEQSAAEAAFLVRQLKPKLGERWLDLPCGYGRHLVELARLRPDLLLAGGDLNRRYLAEPGLGDRARLTCCDMRRLPFIDGDFDVVLNLLNSFGYLEGRGKSDGNGAMIAECARVLRRGGGLVLDLPDRAGLLRLVRTHPRIRYCAEDYEVEENFEWDARAESLVNWTRWRWPAGEEFATYRLRLYTPRQIERMLDQAGFDVRKRFGSFRADGFEAGKSERMLMISRKR